MFQEEGSSSVTSSSPLQLFSSIMSMSPNLGPAAYPSWLRDLKSEERGLYLIHLLLSCANHVANGSLENANFALDQISHLATPTGDTMQRIAAYFTEALADRILKSWPGLYKALHFTKTPLVREEIIVKKLFFELFPFLKLAFLVANQAIVEAMEGEKMIHIIDLNASEPAQWIAFIQALSTRPEGPPHLRITGVHQQKEVLDQVAHKLTEEAEKFDLPFQFNPVASKLENLDVDKLRVKTGEALAISSVLQLHTLLAAPAEDHEGGLHRKQKSPPSGLIDRASTDNGFHLQSMLQMRSSSEPDGVHNRRCSPSNNDSAASSPPLNSAPTKVDTFLNALWGLSPKIMVVAEQDSNHNSSALMERLSEALHFYAALFDCLECTLHRESIERLRVEKMLFGEEVKNIIACEGVERKERHEKLERWVQRLEIAGFGNVGLSCVGLLQAKRLLQAYGCDGYKIKEENGCIVFCWQDRPLFFVSAWMCRR
uniref:GRAS3 n=1 Tax=Tamarix hispida TaxID=189793 RepID=A0A2S1WLM5_9CARY|nr:GRAS3 [Tamarix hispida]